jgi:nucleoside-diphosphate-sugar epimerase
MKILVTGATGFIGREIVSELAENQHQVIGLGNSKKVSADLLKNVTYINADITNYKNLSELEKIQKVELIIHSAGLAHQFGETSREKFEAVNVEGTRNVLRLGVKLQIKHFILIGSTAVYGFVNTSGKTDSERFVIDENSKLNPQTLYAESKLEGERICQAICEQNKIALTIFRLAPVIGEGNVGNVARLISSIDKRRFLWIGDGSNLKSLIYKRDVAKACSEVAANKKNAAEVFNLSAEPVKMEDFVNEISKGLGKNVLPIKIPATLVRKAFQLNAKLLNHKKINKISDTIEKWLSDDIYSAKKIRETYGFKPQTSIKEALHKQIEHYKRHKKQHS